ncbi:sulfurtransferase complex subunit TusC [Kangiella sp. HZ709]|uniref:sulfurtransferase complex subunit TusC n=1 Tax=Kangiella sp. HZ709 TaxID=2666328 RepID=UPI001D0DB2E8|nr:sulfurtransferase complex subunit TusC [Kangiella sp. HZ709]
MKSVCFIFNKPPYGQESGKELLDICLMCSAFEMPITVIFQGDGVLQLIENQQPDILNIKNYSKTFKALKLYGVETVLIDAAGLEKHQLVTENILNIGEIANSKIIQNVIQNTDFSIML